jgi:hypothetical protein
MKKKKEIFLSFNKFMRKLFFLKLILRIMYISYKKFDFYL